jgi:broad specificity phosphatase PhoE
MTTRIFLIRHGESQQNVDDVLSGVTDVPLSQKGKEQCAVLSQYFKNVPIEKVFTSPLQRAKQSADIIFPKHKLPIQIAETLIEFNYGDYEGYRRSQYDADIDDVIRQWLTSPSTLTFPGGDNIQEHARKSFMGIEQLASQNKNAVIACISHRTTIRLVVAKIIGLHLNNFRALPCSNCGVTEISLNEKWQLHSLNSKPFYTSTVDEINT